MFDRVLNTPMKFFQIKSQMNEKKKETKWIFNDIALLQNLFEREGRINKERMNKKNNYHSIFKTFDKYSKW